MKAGLELDILVAEKVMGWSNRKMDLDFPRVMNHMNGQATTVPEFSTNMVAAWQVMEKVFALGKGWILIGHPSAGGPYTAYLDTERDLDWIMQGESAPHAACLAALKAVNAL